MLLLTNQIQTPIPWLRLDALALNIVWILPFIAVTRGQVAGAWKIAACFIPISFGWAAGDVSLAAYIQSTLAKMENVDPDVSALGAVMAFVSPPCDALTVALCYVHCHLRCPQLRPRQVG